MRQASQRLVAQQGVAEDLQPEDTLRANCYAKDAQADLDIYTPVRTFIDSAGER